MPLKINMFSTNKYLVACTIFLMASIFGCASRSQNGATVTYTSNPPGAMASGLDGATQVYFNSPLPLKRYWPPNKLPNGFPGVCLVGRTPTITWPDGVVIPAKDIRICSEIATYEFTKPYQASTPTYNNTPAYEAKKYPNSEKQAPPQSTLPKAHPQPLQDATKKCLRMGLVPGSDDYNLCIKSSGR